MNPQDVPPQASNNMPPQNNYQQQPNQGMPQNPQSNYNYPPQQPISASDDATKAMVGYIGPLIIIPFMATNRTPFLTFHLNQSVNLIISSIAINIAVAIIGALGIHIPMLSTLISLAYLVLMIMGILNAKNGLMKPLPVIGTLFTLIK
ncbi:MAG: DUF4870 domain-containing protein [bacterium]